MIEARLQCGTVGTNSMHTKGWPQLSFFTLIPSSEITLSSSKVSGLSGSLMQLIRSLMKNKDNYQK